jgi:NAD(P)-dependent dehydrogenase (short-subunit alcohol dehydrogenase family)
MDVMKYEDPKRMAETACSFGDGIDMPVDNATKDPGGTLVDLDPGLCRKIIETDLTGPFLLMNAEIPHVIASRGGPIINIASFGGPPCLPGMPAYPSSEAGLVLGKLRETLSTGVEDVFKVAASSVSLAGSQPRRSHGHLQLSCQRRFRFHDRVPSSDRLWVRRGKRFGNSADQRRSEMGGIREPPGFS